MWGKAAHLEAAGGVRRAGLGGGGVAREVRRQRRVLNSPHSLQLQRTMHQDVSNSCNNQMRRRTASKLYNQRGADVMSGTRERRTHSLCLVACLRR
jgi:hypothetical protein